MERELPLEKQQRVARSRYVEPGKCLVASLAVKENLSDCFGRIGKVQGLNGSACLLGDATWPLQAPELAEQLQLREVAGKEMIWKRYDAPQC
jgi:hypothetical protein